MKVLRTLFTILSCFEIKLNSPLDQIACAHIPYLCGISWLLQQIWDTTREIITKPYVEPGNQDCVCFDQIIGVYFYFLMVDWKNDEFVRQTTTTQKTIWWIWECSPPLSQFRSKKLCKVKVAIRNSNIDSSNSLLGIHLKQFIVFFKQKMPFLLVFSTKMSNA